MRQYRITLNGHSLDVKVLDDPCRDHVRVEVDGEIYTVGVETVSPASEGDAVVTASTVAPPDSAATRVSGFRKTSEVVGTPSGAFGAPPAASASQAVLAPLPGVIKSVAVRPGQRVAANDELLVIEAMKMDNVIRAQRPGTVGTVHVAAGRQVAYGEPLLQMTHEK